jgi:hypothetical protein
MINARVPLSVDEQEKILAELRNPPKRTRGARTKCTPTTKECSVCRKVFPHAMFRRDRTSKSGMYSSCKTCTKEKDATWRRIIRTRLDSMKERSKKRHGKKQKDGTRRIMAPSKATYAEFVDKLADQEFRCYYSNLRLDPCTVSPERLDETRTYTVENWYLIHRAFQAAHNIPWSRAKIEQVPLLRDELRIITDDDILTTRQYHRYLRNYEAHCDGGVYGRPVDEPMSIPTWYPTLTAAANAVNGNHSNITKVCQRKITHHKGYVWWFETELVGETLKKTSLSDKIKQLVRDTSHHTDTRNVAREEADLPPLDAPNVTKEYLLDILDAQKGRCAYLDVPLRIETGDWMMSLERLDEDVGYVTGNVVLVCIETNTGSFHWSREFADQVWP